MTQRLRVTIDVIIPDSAAPDGERLMLGSSPTDLLDVIQHGVRAQPYIRGVELVQADLHDDSQERPTYIFFGDKEGTL